MSISIFNPESNGDCKFDKRTFTEFINERGFETTGDISFFNCVFNNTVVLENVVAREISFLGCRFENEFYLGKSSFHNISIHGCTTTGDIDIVSNAADYLGLRSLKAREVEVNGNYQSLEIVSSKIKELLINDVNTAHSHRESKIEFLVENEVDKLIIKCSATFSEVLFKGGRFGYTFFEGEFKKRIELKGAVSIEHLYFESSIFNGRIDIEEGNFNYVHFSRSSFGGLVYINDMSILEQKPRDLIIKDLTLHSSHFEKDVTINMSKIDAFNSSNCHYREVLNFNNSNRLKEEPLITFRMDGINQGSLVVEQAYLDITLSGINLGNIYFKEVDIDTLYLDDYQNTGVLTFSNIRTGNYFVIQNSISGKMNFLNSDVNIFNEIVISESNIDGADFNRYPEKIRARSKNPIAGYGIETRKQRVVSLKNTYNQLKRIAKAKGDIDISSKFESREHTQLLLSKRIGFDSLLLFLNYLSNNNGNSWFRGIVFTVFVALLFFTVYLDTLGIRFTFEDHYSDFILFISSYPKLQLEKFSIWNTQWQTQLTILLARIFVSYGIYQTIAAFRKYGKG
jgi:hypothetical protein